MADIGHLYLTQGFTWAFSIIFCFHIYDIIICNLHKTIASQNTDIEAWNLYFLTKV